MNIIMDSGWPFIDIKYSEKSRKEVTDNWIERPYIMK